jgi:hypothetical protein
VFYINKKTTERDEATIGLFYGPQLLATMQATVRPGTDQVVIEVLDSMEELVVRWHDYVEGDE